MRLALNAMLHAMPSTYGPYLNPMQEYQSIDQSKLSILTILSADTPIPLSHCHTGHQLLTACTTVPSVTVGAGTALKICEDSTSLGSTGTTFAVTTNIAGTTLTAAAGTGAAAGVTCATYVDGVAASTVNGR